MYLKSIEMYGFKSFAERTKIEFDESITCIVGPNGSGKSNITDAIKWVLGEQSSRTLRGDKMEDVIFSGTNNRRSLGLAEVIITFDNSESKVDLDYTEIQVKRRLYKNGDSEYYINNSECRLKDIRELFMDTGIGKDGYSIIGQGRIDEILSNKPEDRRAIFEEASGISKYKFQKSETEKKISKTQENLIRLKDLLSELKSQESGLKAEADQAREYNEIYSELKSYDIYSNTKDLLKLYENIVTNNESYLDNQQQKDIKSKKIAELNESFTNTRANLDEIEFKINELQISNIENIKREKDLKAKIGVYEERLASKKNELITLDERISNLNSSKLKFEGELKDLKNGLEELNNRHKTSSDNYKNLEKDLSDLEREERALLQTIDEIDEKIKGYEKIITENSIKYQRSESLNEDRKLRNIELEKNISDLETELQQNEKLLKEANQDKDNIIGIQEKLLKDKEILELELKAKNEKYESSRNEGNSLQNKINSLENRINILNNMEESYEGYNRSIKSFYSHIKKSNLKIDGLHDTVANLIKVPIEYEKAISTALGSNTQSLVVSDTKTAKFIIELLRKNNYGRITFLPIDGMSSRRNSYSISHNGFIDYAHNLINYDKSYTSVMESILGNIIIVRDMDAAEEISRSLNRRARIVTLEGDVINPGGSITGGSIKIDGTVLHRKNEISAFTRELKSQNRNLIDLNKNMGNAHKAIEELKFKISGIEKDVSLNKIELDRNNMNSIEIKATLKNLSANLNSLRASLETNQMESEDFEKQINVNKESTREYDEKIQDLNNRKNRNVEKYSKIESEINELKTEMEDLRIKLSNEELRLKSHSVDIDKLTINLNDVIEQLDSSNYKKGMISEENINIEETLNSDTVLLEKIIIENSEFKGNNEKLLIEKRDILQNYENSSKEINSENTNLLAIEKKLYDTENSIKRDEQKVISILEYISENYYITLLDELVKTVELKKSNYSMTIREMKQKLSLMGNVNHSAIVQYKNLVERLEFTETQYSDLLETKEKLESMLDEIQTIMKERFIESFNIINKNFKEIFSIMFSGGTAEVVMSDDDNILETGIEIITQPPGKKRQNLSLMSGGERSLTAVSLLFALLKTKPAPFCLLDEIDAALDDANIKRFISYLKTLDDIQFAIITHRKPTMEVADYIYGITMEETGVSKVVSIKFNERKNIHV